MKNLSRKEIERSYSRLIEYSETDIAFIFLTATSAIICTLGLIMDSASVIIGAMVVSPLLSPVLTLSTSLLWNDAKIIKKSLFSIISGLISAVFFSAIITILVPFNLSGSEIIERLDADPLIYFLIAFFSGLAGTFIFFWPGITEAITGIAISVAILPPACIVGIALASYREILFNSSLIVILNVAGIILGSMMILTILSSFQRSDRKK